MAYVTVGQADDLHEWSGLNAAIRQSLVEQGCDVTNIDQLGASYPLRLRLRRRFLASLVGSTYALDRSSYAVSRWSHLASDRVAQLPAVDAVVSTGTLPVAYLEGTVPLALWSDATFHSLRSTYSEYATYSRASIEDGERAERAALQRASLVCYASEWAADDATTFYGVSRRKIRVVPYGANTEPPFADERDAAAAVARRDWSTVCFTFLGVDWRRKGGDTAAAVVQRLNESGTRSVLIVAGCQPPDHIRRLPFVECVGFLSKKNPSQRQRLHQILLQSHFLLLPTMAECFGLVFAEASAYALPSVSRSVGGVPSAVAHGRTGLLLPPAADAAAYCDALRPLLDDRGRYASMCAEAHLDYQRRLNWRVAGARFVTALRETLAARDAAPAS